MTRLRRYRLRLRGERGFTLVEVMMAAMIAAIGVGGVTTILVGSRDLVSDSERGTAAAHVAEREIERALSKPYVSLATKQAPGTSADPKDPRFHVSAAAGGWEYRWDQPSGAPASPVLVDAAAGALDAETPWNDGRLNGTVYRFVTVYDDPTVLNDPSAAPPLLTNGEGKRVTVVVTVNGGQRARKPVLLNSVVLP